MEAWLDEHVGLESNPSSTPDGAWLRVDLMCKFLGDACIVVRLWGWVSELRLVKTNTGVLLEIDLDHLCRDPKLDHGY